MQLVWHRRNDGLWNAECTCHASVCGVEFERREQAETWHFDRARLERERRAKDPTHFGNQIPACGPKLPEPNPNLPDPLVFP